MEKVPNAPRTHDAPLARDPEGHRILLPETAAGWRVRRHTGGRPRLVLDSSKQPMVFPLHYTVTDVEDILAPGTYRLDAIDSEGTPLEITVPLSIHPHRNADPDEIDRDSDERAATVVPTALPGPSSEVRLVLEANVRATQMAFLHNQRTLEASLRMAETLRDGIQVLATSQSEWIKSLAAQRGLFRNAPAQPLLPAASVPSVSETDDDDDDDDDYDEEPQVKGWPDVLAPFAQHMAPLVAPLVAQMIGQRAVPAIAEPSTSSSQQLSAPSSPEPRARVDEPLDADVELASKGWEMRDLVDLNYAAKKGRARRAVQAHEQQAASGSPPSRDPSASGRRRASLQARVMADPALVQQFIAIKGHLRPTEIDEMMVLAERFTDEEQELMLEQLRALPPADGAAILRSTFDELRRVQVRPSRSEERTA